MPGNPALKKKSLCDRVCDELRRSIANGLYRPGDRLPSEGELCEIFLVGRGSVREALKRLEMVGLVNIIHGRGVIVAECDAVERRLRFLDTTLVLGGGQAAEILEVRRALERLALHHLLAAESNGNESLRSLMQPMSDADGREDAFQLADTFLAALVNGAGNEVLTQVHRCLGDVLGAGSRVDLPPQIVVDSCGRILDGLAAGDGATAEEGLLALHEAISNALALNDG